MADSSIGERMVPGSAFGEKEKAAPTEGRLREWIIRPRLKLMH
jgi:hypothetical protein